jgi:GNAT superfamily N-acetyltransferase
MEIWREQKLWERRMSILRYLEVTDFQPIVVVVDEWWNGRPVAILLQKLFFIHFRPTSFVIEEQGEIQGFLVGFRSQTTSTHAYIHFVGTHPQHRGKGIGRQLYQHFFEVVREFGCTEVFSITTPVNKGSIVFHRLMGFEIMSGDATIDGVQVISNYAGRDRAGVLFRYRLM